MKTRMFLCLLMATPLLVLPACGDDPVSPDPDPDPVDPSVPKIPTLTDPSQDPPHESETLSVRKPLKGSFSPQSEGAKCDWVITGRGRYEEAPTWIDCYGDDETLFSGTEWSDALAPYVGCFDACMAVSDYCTSGLPLKGDWLADRFLLMDDGVVDPNPGPFSFDAPEVTICRTSVWPAGCISKVHIAVSYTATPAKLAKAPYVRRDRFWECTAWPDGSMVKRHTGAGETWVGYEYSRGSSITETESFAWTLGAEVSAEYEGLKAAISSSMTKTFSTTVTVSQDSTVSKNYHLRGEAGKITCHVLWVLVERYTFVHENGAPYSDPNYRFEPAFEDEVRGTEYDFEIRGTQEHVAQYVFDASGQLLEVRVASLE